MAGADRGGGVNINLHIERLVLDGVKVLPGQHHLLQITLASELARMLTDNGLSSSFVQGAFLPRMSTSGIQLTGNKPMELGQQIARSVYGGIGNE